MNGKGQPNSLLLVKYKNNIYDITDFANKHPGGRNTLIGKNQKDIGFNLHRTPPHSDAALYLLNEYKLGSESATENNGDGPKYKESGHTMVNSDDSMEVSNLGNVYNCIHSVRIES